MPVSTPARYNRLTPKHPDSLSTLQNLGTACRSQKKYAKAEALFTKLADVRERVLGKDHPDTIFSLGSLGGLMLDQKNVLGASLAGQGYYAEAEPLLIGGYQGMLLRVAPDPADKQSALRQATEWLGQLYQRWGKPAKATHWRTHAKAAFNVLS